VRIASWNVNSVKQRLPRLLPWLDERQPDVVCLQETKLAGDAFRELLGDALAERDYAVAVHGEPTWNGVAVLSRVGLDDVVKGLAGEPGFPDPEARAVAATCAGIRVVSVYVPNGRSPGSEHYQYKLAWLAALRDAVAAGPEDTAVCGDMNIAPTDEDVFNPEAYVGHTHVTEPERAALAELLAVGLHDVVRDHWPEERSDPGRRLGVRPRARGLGGPSGPEGQRAQRPRARDRGLGRGSGWGCRPGGATAVAPGSPERQVQAPAVGAHAG